MKTNSKIAQVENLKWLIMLIPLIFVSFTLLVPLSGILKKSFIDSNGFTIEYYIKAFTEPLYLTVLYNTLKTACIVTLMALLLAYPVAYLSVCINNSLIKRLITAGILIPYWISMLVRIFAWQIILQTNGILNQFLMFFHITAEPLEFMYTSTAVYISMTHILLPYMFLSLQSNMEGINQTLITAAIGMGAKPRTAFKDVFLPLSLPGIFSGSLMVFVLSLGFYIAPALLGGPNNMMISNIIEQNMNSFNSSLAAALSVQLLIIVFVIVAIASKLVGNIFIKSK
ncbi:MAG: hypothetical protein ATN34_01265 [Epulopiscium sp. Nele67-Bin002]|nr:MAG: hypothetical protein ATN34_01265 [Epulopiscium sp. Nele67-Bin002]OON92771.1 MAG: hypothetical protein ATN33_06730 [Epulopiscium sp. Nele67-Bin001]